MFPIFIAPLVTYMVWVNEVNCGKEIGSKFTSTNSDLQEYFLIVINTLTEYQRCCTAALLSFNEISSCAFHTFVTLDGSFSRDKVGVPLQYAVHLLQIEYILKSHFNNHSYWFNKNYFYKLFTSESRALLCRDEELLSWWI